jgi:glycosyltransferase involved in cell wall biosynthesis
MTATVEIVVPVYNEEHELEASIVRLVAYVRLMPFTVRVTIADNASTDATSLIARRLADEYAEVGAVQLKEKGRGRALKQTWLGSRSVIVAYMDVDLSTDLNALLPLVAPLLSGHSDLAVGSRLSRGSRVLRGAKRELISRCYNLLLHATLRTRFADAQCGFKAMRRESAARLLPMVLDDGWFFDTELLVLAERAGLRIHEVPVDWVDDPDSTVDVVRTASQDLRGIVRLGWSLLTRRVALDAIRRDHGRMELGRQPLPSGAAPVFFAHDQAYAPSSEALPASPRSSGRNVSTMTASSSKYSTPIDFS